MAMTYGLYILSELLVVKTCLIQLTHEKFTT